MKDLKIYHTHPVDNQWLIEILASAIMQALWHLYHMADGWNCATGSQHWKEIFRDVQGIVPARNVEQFMNILLMWGPHAAHL
jgi:hypothetical protein